MVRHTVVFSGGASLGYLEARYPAGRRVLAADLVERYDLQRTALARLLPRNPVLSLWLLLGDVDVDEVRLEEGGWADHGAAHNPHAPSIHGLFVVGDLRVRGPVHNLSAVGAQSLFVMGDLRASIVAVNGAEVVVRGSTRVDDVICCAGPGESWFDGDVTTRLMISDECPIWVTGRLAAPVLDTGRSRVGLLGADGVRAAPGDVPPSVVLSPEVAPPAGGAFAFETLHHAVMNRRPLLSPAFLSGAIDVEAVRLAQVSRREVGTAIAQGRYLHAARVIRGAGPAAERDAATSIDLAAALFAAHERSENHEGLEEALRLLDSALGAEPADELVRAFPRALIQRASILLQLDGFGATDPERGLDQAWADCARVLAVLPPEHHATAHHLMGRLLYVRRSYAESVERLVTARELDEGLPDIDADLAKVLWMLDRESDAVPYATRAIESADADDFVWYVRGKCLQRLGRLDEAAADLTFYLERHPDDPFTVVSLMEIELSRDAVPAALALARAAVDRAPTDADSALRFGRVLRERSLHDQSIPFLRHAVDLDPDDAEVVRELAIALLGMCTQRQDDATDGPVASADVLALSSALRLLELSSDPDHVTYLRGECRRMLGDLVRAEHDLSGYLNQHPDAAPGMASLARVYLAAGRGEQARQAIRKALRADPESEYVRQASRHLVRIEAVRPL